MVFPCPNCGKEHEYIPNQEVPLQMCECGIGTMRYSGTVPIEMLSCEIEVIDG